MSAQSHKIKDTTDTQQIQEKVVSIIKHASLSRISAQSNDQFSINEWNGSSEGRIFANWMSIILISGKSLRITFKTHFNHKDAKRLVASNPGRAEITPNQTIDLIKEFCNLTAGYTKQIFRECDHSLGISLPLCTRGFYEIFSTKNKITDYYVWTLDFPEVQLICSALIQSHDLQSLSNILTYKLSDSTDNAGELEVF